MSLTGSPVDLRGVGHAEDPERDLRDRVAVRRRGLQHLRGQRTSGSRLVVDDDRLAQHLGCILGEHPHGDVGGAARRKSDDQFDRACWKALGPCREGGRESGCRTHWIQRRRCMYVTPEENGKKWIGLLHRGLSGVPTPQTPDALSPARHAPRSGQPPAPRAAAGHRIPCPAAIQRRASRAIQRSAQARRQPVTAAGSATMPQT